MHRTYDRSARPWVVLTLGHTPAHIQAAGRGRRSEPDLHRVLTWFVLPNEPSPRVASNIAAGRPLIYQEMSVVVDIMVE
jgi:hypothetical protein